MRKEKASVIPVLFKILGRITYYSTPLSLSRKTGNSFIVTCDVKRNVLLVPNRSGFVEDNRYRMHAMLCNIKQCQLIKRIGGTKSSYMHASNKSHIFQISIVMSSFGSCQCPRIAAVEYDMLLLPKISILGQDAS